MDGGIPPRDHGFADDVDKVPAFEQVAGSVDFDEDGLVLLGSVHVEKQAELSRVDVVVEKDRADVAVNVEKGDGAIELHPIQAGALSLVNGVIVKRGRFV